MTKLDIFSDPICPWCYIGKTKLDRALESNPDHDFVITWRPFQLNPEMPPSGMDRREYLETKFGGQQGAIDAYMPVVQAAEEIGLSIDFAGIKRTPSTLNAHRLIHWAGIEGCQNAVVDRLFKAYFKEGRDISDHSVLARIGAGAGMDRDVVMKLLQSDADTEEIRTQDADARVRGIRGVPCFIIDNQFAISGAQPIEMWNKVIADIRAQTMEPDT